MSAFKTLECNIVDLNCLLEALKLLGLEPEIYENPQYLFGYRNDQREEKANIIIGRNKINKYTGASNDIGFKWNEDTKKYDMIVSEYDKKLKMDLRIIQAYTKVVIEKALEENGFKIKVNINDDELKQKRIDDINIVARKII